jgi:hypothetical protein
MASKPLEIRKAALRSWRFWLGAMISAVLLWASFRRVSFADLLSAIAIAEPSWLVLAVLFQVLAIAARAARWRQFFNGHFNYSHFFWGQSIGYLFNNVFPFRLGELVRSYFLASKARVSIVRVIATVVAERLLDLILVTSAIIVLLPLMPVPEALATSGFILGCISLMVMWSLVRISKARINANMLTILPFSLPAAFVGPVRSGLDKVGAGLSVFDNPRNIAQAGAWSVLSWLFSVGIYWSVLRSIEPAATWIEAAFLVASLSVSMTIPSSPGYLGVYQFIGRHALQIPFGAKYGAAESVAIVLVTYAIFYIVPSIIAVIGLSKMKLSLAGLRREAVRQSENEVS